MRGGERIPELPALLRETRHSKASGTGLGSSKRQHEGRLVGGTIEAAPGIVSALYDAGESAIELGNVLGWFGFVVTDVHRGEIKMTGRIKDRP